MHTLRLIGPGRAARSLAGALEAAGWEVRGLLGRRDDLYAAASGVDVLVLGTPDDALREVAGAVRPEEGTVVVHLSGALGLEVLAGHPRRAGLHPLVPLPDPVTGARRLGEGVTFAVAGDAVAWEMVEALGGRAVEVPDERRAAYHAAACMAANHLVGLMGQVERVAGSVGMDLEDFLDLSRAALEDVARVGPREALTGPAARGDLATLARHRAALAAQERSGYDAGVALVQALAGPRAAGERRVPVGASR